MNEITKVMSQKGITKRTVRISKGIGKKDYHFYKAYLELNWKEVKSETQGNSQDESW